VADVSSRAAWLAFGALGVALLVPFDWPVTIALGVACLLAWVAWGTWLIATPELLAGDDEER
jgi:hypothetical protein